MAILDASGRIGELRPITFEGQSLRAYVPRDLPFEPELKLDPESQQLLQEAYLALGRLDGAAAVVPNSALLLRQYLRKEAVLSSQIEGTQSSLEDFLRQEAAPLQRTSDFLVIHNYLEAVRFGLQAVEKGGIDLQLLEALHARLLSSGRGSKTLPGKIRTRQNFVGTRGNLFFTPPPPEAVRDKLDNLIWFMHSAEFPGGILTKAAVAHAQFETIHPFMDGNGRLGRMLIVLMLCKEKVLRLPLLFPSLFLKKNRETYYQLLQDTREFGDWESWLKFFLQAVTMTASIAAKSALKLVDLIADDKAELASLGRRSGSALLLFDQLLQQPHLTAALGADMSGLSRPTVLSMLDAFVYLGICEETSGRTRDRIYRYSAYLDVLNEGTELE